MLIVRDYVFGISKCSGSRFRDKRDLKNLRDRDFGINICWDFWDFLLSVGQGREATFYVIFKTLVNYIFEHFALFHIDLSPKIESFIFGDFLISFWLCLRHKIKKMFDILSMSSSKCCPNLVFDALCEST